MPSFIRLPRSLSLATVIALAPAFASVHAQSACGGSIVGDVAQVSVSAGGVQNLSLHVPPSEAEFPWQILGTLSGTAQPTPFFAVGGLFLQADRYTLRMYNGGAGFVAGAVAGFTGGPLVPFNSHGNALVQVVIPANSPSVLVGRTLHHGFYRTSFATLLPECGSATVALTLVP